MFVNKEKQIRIIWRYLILVGLFLAIAFFLRFIPIRIHTANLVRNGLSSTSAEAKAQSLFLEDNVWASFIGIFQGLSWYLVLYLLIRSIEKRKFSFQEIGFSRTFQNIYLVPIGVIVGLALYYGYFLAQQIFNQPPFHWSPNEFSSLALVLIFLDITMNVFGEEAAFRAYFQDRLIQRHGVWWGVAISSCAFILPHLLLYPLSITSFVAGIFLAAMFGFLYLWTDSIFLVGTLHTILNLAPRLLGQSPSDIGLIIINGLGFIVALVLFAAGKKYKGSDRKGKEVHP